MDGGDLPVCPDTKDFIIIFCALRSVESGEAGISQGRGRRVNEIERGYLSMISVDAYRDAVFFFFFFITRPFKGGIREKKFFF